MAVKLDASLTKFKADCRLTLGWLGSTEALWMTAPPTTDVRRSLKKPQMEALYESAFLRIFASWEVFQEDATIRMMAGAGTSTYKPVAASGSSKYSTMKAARAALYNNRSYLLWHNPDGVIKRVAKVLDGSPLETELTSNKSKLEHYGNIRHSIAHGSDDAVAKFKAASQYLTGVTHKGSPGKFLRSQDVTDTMNMRRWIFVITTDLQHIASKCIS